MSPDSVSSPLDYGIVGFALLLVWQVLSVVKILILSKKMEQTQGTFACQTDPLYPNRVKEIHECMNGMKEKILHGDFQCNWKDREEVRDFMEALREQTKAAHETTGAIHALTRELRLTRNGKSA